MSALRRLLLRPETRRVFNEPNIVRPQPATPAPVPANECLEQPAENSVPSLKSEELVQPKPGVNSMSEETLSAVANLFLSTRAYDERLARLGAVFDQADTFGRDAVAAFELMVKLAHSLGRLVEPYRAVNAFQSEMANLAREFEPISGVQKIFRDVSESLRDQLKAVASALEPAKKLQAQLAQLASALEPAFGLQAQFLQLAEVFSPPIAVAVDSNLKRSGEAARYAEALNAIDRVNQPLGRIAPPSSDSMHSMHQAEASMQATVSSSR
jgi:hypothetical protein